MMQFEQPFMLTDDYLHTLITSHCLTQYMSVVKDRADIVIQGFANIKETVTAAKVAATLLS